MVRRDQMFIHNLEGTIYYKDVPLVYIKIVDRKLVDAKIINMISHFVNEIRMFGLTYVAINQYYKDRVVQDGAMFVREYLDALGLQHYDFEAIVKASSGWNPRDRQWIKFEGGRFQSWEQIYNELKLEDEVISAKHLIDNNSSNV